jgi:hypothetical protein
MKMGRKEESNTVRIFPHSETGSQRLNASNLRAHKAYKQTAKE